MHVYLQDKILAFNVRQLTLLMQYVEGKRMKTGSAIQPQTYRVFLHRTSGQLLFPELSKEGVSLNRKVWKELLIFEHFDPMDFSISFGVRGKAAETPSWRGVHPDAIRRLKETLGVLNREAWLLRGPHSDLPTKLRVLARLVVEEESEQRIKNPFIASWHSLDRYQAEKVLKNAPEGTFLLRQDSYAALLEKELAAIKHMRITCVTATYVGHEGDIHDLTFVHFDQHWTCYNDDPTLSGPSYDDLESVLNHFKNLLKFPLYREWLKAA